MSDLYDAAAKRFSDKQAAALQAELAAYAKPPDRPMEKAFSRVLPERQFDMREPRVQPPVPETEKDNKREATRMKYVADQSQKPPSIGGPGTNFGNPLAHKPTALQAKEDVYDRAARVQSEKDAAQKVQPKGPQLNNGNKKDDRSDDDRR